MAAADTHASGLELADQIMPHVPKNATWRTKELEEDAMTDNTSRTDDDPVGDAFREALDDHGVVDDDEDGEVILWNPRFASLAPLYLHSS